MLLTAILFCLTVIFGIGSFLRFAMATIFSLTSMGFYLSTNFVYPEALLIGLNFLFLLMMQLYWMLNISLSAKLGGDVKMRYILSGLFSSINWLVWGGVLVYGMMFSTLAQNPVYWTFVATIVITDMSLACFFGMLLVPRYRDQFIVMAKKY